MSSYIDSGKPVKFVRYAKPSSYILNDNWIVMLNPLTKHSKWRKLVGLFRKKPCVLSQRIDCLNHRIKSLEDKLKEHQDSVESNFKLRDVTFFKKDYILNYKHPFYSPQDVREKLIKDGYVMTEYLENSSAEVWVRERKPKASSPKKSSKRKR